jgi:N-acyl-D-aspartate/D-glutamate deacylase
VFDLVIENGRVFDGGGGPSRVANVGVSGGRVACVDEAPLPRSPETEVLDARGLWVMPATRDGPGFFLYYPSRAQRSPGVEPLRRGGS